MSELIHAKIWYDTLTTLCKDCHFYERKVNQKGFYKEYDCCHLYGYILHDDSGISDSCDGFRTEEAFLEQERKKELLRKRRGRK